VPVRGRVPGVQSGRQPLLRPRAARASTVYGSLGVALVSLFLFARLAVAAAELNATLWERRRPGGPAGRRPT
jgi:hypothetical protein